MQPGLVQQRGGPERQRVMAEHFSTGAPAQLVIQGFKPLARSERRQRNSGHWALYEIDIDMGPIPPDKASLLNSTF